MWGTVLKIVPTVIGVISSGFGVLATKSSSNKGATLGTLVGMLGAGGLFSNPDVRNFIAETLTRLAEIIEVAK